MMAMLACQSPPEISKVLVPLASRRVGFDFGYAHGPPGYPADVGEARYLEATEHILDSRSLHMGAEIR